MRRVSEEALTWRGRLHRVSPPCPGPAYLCWIPSPAAYRTVLASGWLQTKPSVLVFGVNAAQQGLASALPGLLPLTLQSTPNPHTPALRRGGHSKFWPMWAKVLSPPLSSLPTQGQQRLAGIQASHGLALTLIRVRGLGQQSIRSDQIRSVAQSCPTLCDPMNRSTPGLPVHHQLLEFTQTHVHRVSDAVQPSPPLSSPSPPAPNPSQHQSLLQ